MMRRWAVWVCLAAAAATSGCASLVIDSELSINSAMRASLAEPGARLDPNAVRDLLNDYRRTRGLSQVALDPKLMRMAEEQAAAMAKADQLSHDVEGAGPFQMRLERSEFGAGHASENLGVGYRSVADVIAGWRRSPSHHANLLMAAATHIGVAASSGQRTGGRPRIYWALVLAQPAQEAAAGTQWRWD